MTRFIVLIILVLPGFSKAGPPPVFWPRPDGLIVPYWGHQTDYWPIKEGARYRDPGTIYRIWFNDNLRTVTDVEGVSLYDRHKEGALYFGTISRIAFREVSYNDAKWRFHYAPQSVIYQVSKSGHSANTPGSVSYAVSADGKDIYTSDHFKPEMGGGKISQIASIRFPWHAWICDACKFRPQGQYSEDCFARPPPVPGWPMCQSSGAMRNPNMSGPILWTTADYIRWHTKAGFDSREIGVLQQTGTAWIWRDK